METFWCLAENLRTCDTVIGYSAADIHFQSFIPTSNHDPYFDMYQRQMVNQNTNNSKEAEKKSNPKPTHIPSNPGASSSHYVRRDTLIPTKTASACSTSPGQMETINPPMVITSSHTSTASSKHAVIGTLNHSIPEIQTLPSHEGQNEMLNPSKKQRCVSTLFFHCIVLKVSNMDKLQ